MTKVEWLNSMLSNMFRAPHDPLYFASEKLGAIMAARRAKQERYEPGLNAGRHKH